MYTQFACVLVGVMTVYYISVIALYIWLIFDRQVTSFSYEDIYVDVLGAGLALISSSLMGELPHSLYTWNGANCPFHSTP